MQHSSQLNNDDSVFITPFEVMESEPKVNASSIIEQTNITLVPIQAPACPECNGEMIKRIAKKRARQGQAFYGCHQFPKCRGVVNIDQKIEPNKALS